MMHICLCVFVILKHVRSDQIRVGEIVMLNGGGGGPGALFFYFFFGGIFF